MPPLLMSLVLSRIPSAAPRVLRPILRPVMARVSSGFVEPQLATHADYWEASLAPTGWFAGSAFSAADVMMSFPVETGSKRIGYSQRPHLVAFLERIARPAGVQAGPRARRSLCLRLRPRGSGSPARTSCARSARSRPPASSGSSTPDRLRAEDRSGGDPGGLPGLVPRRSAAGRGRRRGWPIGFAVLDAVDGATHLAELDVSPAVQGRGVGTVLIEAVCGFALGRGHRAVTLTTFREVRWNGPYYASRGFVALDPASIGPISRRSSRTRIAAGRGALRDAAGRRRALTSSGPRAILGVLALWLGAVSAHAVDWVGGDWGGATSSSAPATRSPARSPTWACSTSPSARGSGSTPAPGLIAARSIVVDGVIDGRAAGDPGGGGGAPAPEHGLDGADGTGAGAGGAGAGGGCGFPAAAGAADTVGQAATAATRRRSGSPGPRSPPRRSRARIGVRPGRGPRIGRRRRRRLLDRPRRGRRDGRRRARPRGPVRRGERHRGSPGRRRRARGGRRRRSGRRRQRGTLVAWPTSSRGPAWST